MERPGSFYPEGLQKHGPGEKGAEENGPENKAAKSGSRGETTKSLTRPTTASTTGWAVP